GSPLFNVTFALQNAEEGTLQLPGLTLSPLNSEEGASRFDLILDMFETEQGLKGGLKYQTDLFDDSTARRMMAHFVRLLEGIAAAPDVRLYELPLLTEEEQRRMLVSWNETRANFPGRLCLHQLSEPQPERPPDNVALEFEALQLSFAELNRQADRLAQRLRTRGVGPESCVGLCCRRSAEMVIGILAILKAGGAYVPLEPTYPQERL